MSEKGSASTSERDQLSEIIFIFLGLFLLLVLILSLRKLQGFLFYGFPEENICLFVIIFVHVILSDKILRSYCLKDKNITIKSKTMQYDCAKFHFHFKGIPYLRKG